MLDSLLHLFLHLKYIVKILHNQLCANIQINEFRFDDEQPLSRNQISADFIRKIAFHRFFYFIKPGFSAFVFFLDDHQRNCAGLPLSLAMLREADIASSSKSLTVTPLF